MNAAANRPRVSTCRAPPAPFAGEDRVGLQERHRVEYRGVVGLWILCATSGGATAHSVETDFAGLNVRSKPVTDLFPNFRREPGADDGMTAASISLLTDCGLEELESHSARAVTHVLSILAPQWPGSIASWKRRIVR